MATHVNKETLNGRAMWNKPAGRGPREEKWSMPYGLGTVARCRRSASDAARSRCLCLWRYVDKASHRAIAISDTNLGPCRARCRLESLVMGPVKRNGRYHMGVERPYGHIASTTERLEQAWASAMGPATTRAGACRPASLTGAADASASKTSQDASDASRYDSVSFRLWAWRCHRMLKSRCRKRLAWLSRTGFRTRWRTRTFVWRKRSSSKAARKGWG